MVWLEAWGTYAKSGPYNNVTMGGSPNGSMYGLNLTSAKKMLALEMVFNLPL